MDEHIEIKVNHVLQSLWVKFLDYVSREDLLNLFEYEYKLISDHELNKCLIDLRLLPVYDKGSEEHVKNEWFPKVSSLGVKYIAFVIPEELLGQMQMTLAHKHVDSKDGIIVKHFKNEASATEWLSSC